MPAIDQNIRELIAQMPPTDKDAAPAAAKPGEGQGADPKTAAQAPASKFTGPDPAGAVKVFEQALAAGRDGLRELIKQTRVPADLDFENYKAAYLLHGLVVYLGKPGQETRRGELAGVLAAESGNERLTLPVRAFLIRELQWLGDRNSVPALGKALANETLCAEAAGALVAIGEGAAAQLRSAYASAKGSCRRTIIQSLALLADPEAKGIWRKSLADEDLETRLISGWALAKVGDAESSAALLKLAENETGYARTKATHACLLLAEQLLASGNKGAASRIYTHLRDKRTDPPERYLRDVAVKALESPGPL